MVALSVSISAKTSPALTASPSRFSQRARLPSVIVGESAGIRISIGITPLRSSSSYALKRSRRRWHPATTSSTCGSARRSRLAAYGIGTSLPVTRRTGASRWSKACSIMTAASSAPMPKVGQLSSTETRRLVFLTEATMVWTSSGRIVRRSITSAAIPSLASASAACERPLDHQAEGDDGDVGALAQRPWPGRSAARSPRAPAPRRSGRRGSRFRGTPPGRDRGSRP